MNASDPLTQLQFWVAAWAVLVFVILTRHARLGRSVGLLLCYVLSLSALHWLAAALLLLPWTRSNPPEVTIEGLRQSVFGLIGLAVATELVTAHARRRGVDQDEAADSSHILPPKVVNLCLIAGAVLYALLFTSAGQLASLRAIASTGSTLIAVGVALKCWNAYHAQRWTMLASWVALTAVFPFVTVFVQGFLGYGLAAMVIVLSFIAGIHRPKAKELALAMLFTYVGLSVYVTYMRDRTEIRELVWYGASSSERLERLQRSLELAEWFDPTSDEHIRRVLVRLDQNFLVGAAVEYLQSGGVEYANGATFRDAALSLIPRALWPDKTIVAGSGDLVSTYTGIRFDEDTSVGIGQVLEMYVNFGTPGVVVGFMIIGALVVVADRRARAELDRRRPGRFLIWYLPGLSLLQVGGSLSEVTATALAGYVVGTVFAYARRTPEETVDETEAAALVRVTN